MEDNVHAGTPERTGGWFVGAERGCEYVRGNLFSPYTYICIKTGRRVRETGQTEESRFGIRADDKKICMDLFD